MENLSTDESRVLGVLIEKEFTTPEQYPLSLNALVNGSNQKNNRDPVMTMDEPQAFDALESLRGKALAVRSDTVGSRVNKYRHQAGETLRIRPAKLAILAELLLRGPQTLGELRGRASRMHAFDSLDAVKGMLEAMMTREAPLVRQLPPSPGSRAERYGQLLCPEQAAQAAPAAATHADAPPGSPSLQERVARLESEGAALREAIRKLALAVGEPDPLDDSVPPEN